MAMNEVGRREVLHEVIGALGRAPVACNPIQVVCDLDPVLAARWASASEVLDAESKARYARVMAGLRDGTQNALGARPPSG